MIDITPPRHTLQSYGEPGSNGWGLAVLVKDPRKPANAEADQTEHASEDVTKQAMENEALAELKSVLEIQGTERERDGDAHKERGTIKKLMGHPCASGCGHICWVANDSSPSTAAP